jgi:hypothetical protein
VEEESRSEEVELWADSVILACGGFGNDHTTNSLLREFAPALESLPTTNGSFATGMNLFLFLFRELLLFPDLLIIYLFYFFILFSFLIISRIFFTNFSGTDWMIVWFSSL